jgi:hypothetical protein
VTLPDIFTKTARIKVEAIDNIFFDASNADFAIKPFGDVNVDGKVDCADSILVKSLYGKHTGDAAFDPKADVNNDGVIDIRDWTLVRGQVPPGTPACAI